ncbi:MAG: efflux RND transporter periplasmic adaptor subunit [Firmicutes bacterium]|nr:efflux RND transporter periplasmic adaptor subunit [Bacillota bacterium]
MKVKPDTATVQYEDIFNLTGVTGSVLPYSEAMSFSVDGTLGSLEVLPGQAVKKGDILAVLDTSALQEQLDSLQEQLKHAQEQAALINRNHELAIQICQIRITDGDDSYANRLLQLDLEEARLKLKQAKEQQAFSQQQLTASIAKLTAQIESAVIRAPFDGTVSWISARAAAGNSVSAKAAICYLSDETRLCIRTERIFPSVLQNCDRIYAKIGEKEYELTARENSVNEDLLKSLNGIDLTTTFDFAGASLPDGVQSGQNALVCYRSGYCEHVLCVPSNALFRDAGSVYVYRIDNHEEKQRVSVTIGTSTTLRTEITSGLAEGDVVYVKD